jgi:membrane-associated phospholipid phosphatase
MIAENTMKHYCRVIAIFISFWMPLTAGFAQQQGEAQKKAANESGLRLFLKDVKTDYKNTFSKETAIWYGAGLAAAGLVHLADEDIREAFEDTSESAHNSMTAGGIYGSVSVQLPLAVGWWAVGHAMHSPRDADTGRDLLRAQINAITWTSIIKLAVHRERPNGEKFSFPSAHSSATFATAMVMQEHYGWKVGVPFFLGAGYTAVSRVHDNEHWASDVVFGAAIGMASARTVTLHLRKHKISLVPVAVPGGAALAFIPHR